MRFAYADPPYLGRCSYYGHNHPEGNRPFDGLCWNDAATHKLLIDWLSTEYPDGWAMSASSPSLRELLPMTPSDTRVMSWVKPFASFKPGINPGYCWEPILVRGGRKMGRDVPTVRDYVSANILLKKGCTGAKPPEFCRWLFAVLGTQRGDTLDDLFTGSGVVGEAWRAQWEAA